MKTMRKKFSFEFALVLPCIAYARGLVLAAVYCMLMLLSHTSLHFLVLSFVLACACIALVRISLYN